MRVDGNGPQPTAPLKLEAMSRSSRAQPTTEYDCSSLYKSLLWLDASRGAISVYEKRLFLRRDWITVISADSRKPIVVRNFEWSDELYVAWEV